MKQKNQASQHPKKSKHRERVPKLVAISGLIGFLSIFFGGIFATHSVAETISPDKSIQTTYTKETPPIPYQNYDVLALGAATSGSPVEGVVGAIHRGNRHRFYCHSRGPTPGQLGPQASLKLAGFKDQPGVFPAPLMGCDSLHFVFSFQESGRGFIPVIVKPDGTIFKGLPMNAYDSPQTLVIPYPAQTGIYTLFVLHHPNEGNKEELGSSKYSNYGDSIGGLIQVTVKTSSHPKKIKNLFLKPFGPNEKQAELISAEFIYTH